MAAPSPTAQAADHRRAAAEWLRVLPRSARGPAVGELKKRFNLTPLEAIRVIRMVEERD